ncbi:hypothetical protein BDN70DRAFT_898607 [Pholiota conissans]|uniref:Uncharacterized protein n=1 Tax=Pholiota conissans TaxID=109636 RepID=A0A9P6CWR9_9AGAR|nr:hypothetical protein BDN70DRAFT_898607 [Pholiota conissans]
MNGDEVEINAWIWVIGDRQCKGGEVGSKWRKRGSKQPDSVATLARSATCAKPPPPDIPTPPTKPRPRPNHPPQINPHPPTSHFQHMPLSHRSRANDRQPDAIVGRLPKSVVYEFPTRLMEGREPRVFVWLWQSRGVDTGRNATAANTVRLHAESTVTYSVAVGRHRWVGGSVGNVNVNVKRVIADFEVK